MSELEETGVVLSEEGKDVVVGKADVVNPVAVKSPTKAEKAASMETKVKSAVASRRRASVSEALVFETDFDMKSMAIKMEELKVIMPIILSTTVSPLIPSVVCVCN